MADWIIRRGIPLALVSAYLVAVAISGGHLSALFVGAMTTLRSTFVELVPRILQAKRGNAAQDNPPFTGGAEGQMWHRKRCPTHAG